MSINRSPGRPKKISDEKLKEMALAIKHKNRGKIITFQFLQDETGIGRQTWKRRIGDFINELNQPIIIPTNEATEDIYFPNIEEIFERHKNNNTKIIQELFHFEQMFRQFYLESASLKEKLISLEADIQKSLKDALELAEKRANHYESLYKTLVVSSGFSHLREEKGIKDNLLQFNPLYHTSLEENEFKRIFSNPKENSKESSSIQELTSMFPDIFKEE